MLKQFIKDNIDCLAFQPRTKLKFKKLIAWLLVSVPVLVLFVTIAYDLGILATLIIFAILTVIIICPVIGFKMLLELESKDETK